MKTQEKPFSPLLDLTSKYPSYHVFVGVLIGINFHQKSVRRRPTLLVVDVTSTTHVCLWREIRFYTVPRAGEVDLPVLNV